MNSEIDIRGLKLKTGRLTLRPWVQTDLDDLYEYARVDGVGQNAGWLPHKSRNESQIVLNMFIDSNSTFAIEYGGKVIGSLGVDTYDEALLPAFADKRCRELGFVLSRDYWGRGLMTEAVREVLRWLFDDMALDAVFCGHFAFNTRSAHVQEKCGFRTILTDQRRSVDGQLHEHHLNVLTREEYK